MQIFDLENISISNSPRMFHRNHLVMSTVHTWYLLRYDPGYLETKSDRFVTVETSKISFLAYSSYKKFVDDYHLDHDSHL